MVARVREAVSLAFKDLAFVAGNYHFVDILKEGGIVIASSKDFISSGFPIEVASTFSFMKLMLDPICINLRQTFTQ